MDSFQNLLFFSLLLCFSFNGVYGYATVTGTVFCDQCKDGEKSLFDFPVSGVKVSVTCSNGNGQVYMSREEITNWVGGFVMKFDGTPDLSNCYAQVSNNGDVKQDSSSCSIASGPAQKLKLVFSVFGIEMFVADSLLAQPLQPLASCPKPPVAPALPPPQVPIINPPSPATPVTPATPATPGTPATPSPQFKLPPLPPMPFVDPSACSHQLWTRPEYKCYWRLISPDTKVVVAFGLIAGKRYGTDITLKEALNGRGEAYKTLLREATTSLLNSYNSLHFPYSSISVITHTNLALLGHSQHDVLVTALRFLRANSGGTCKFTVCK